MKLIALIRQFIDRTAVLAVLLSLLSGLSSAALAVWLGRQLTAIAELPLWHLAVAALFVAFSTGLDVMARRILQRWSGHTVYVLRVRLAAQILALPFVRYERVGKARLQALLTEDVLVVQQAMSTLPAVSIGAMKAVACLLYLAWLSPLVTTVLVCAGGLIILSQRALQRRALRFSRSWLKTRDDAYQKYRGLI